MTHRYMFPGKLLKFKLRRAVCIASDVTDGGQGNEPPPCQAK